MNAEFKTILANNRHLGTLKKSDKYLHLWRLFGKKQNNGLSGHGLQQAPAIGYYLTELIIGITPALDLSFFRLGRILENKPLSEDGLVWYPVIETGFKGSGFSPAAGWWSDQVGR